MTRGALVTKDLFFVAKVREVALQCGVEVTVLRSPEALQKFASEPLADALFLVDLDKPGIELGTLSIVLAPHQAAGSRVVSFFSHVHEELAERGESLGLGEIMPRSRFVRVLPDLFRS